MILINSTVLGAPALTKGVYISLEYFKIWISTKRISTLKKLTKLSLHTMKMFWTSEGPGLVGKPFSSW